MTELSGKTITTQVCGEQAYGGDGLQCLTNLQVGPLLPLLLPWLSRLRGVALVLVKQEEN